MSFRSARDVSWIVLAKSIGWLGDAMATMALMLRLQSSGHGAGAVAALLIADALPIVLLSGPAGRLVDRYDSRNLLVSAGLAQAAVCLVLVEVHSPAQVLVLVALLGAGQSVAGATWQALLAQAAGTDLARAMSRSQTGMTLAGVAAPALAGLLVGLFSVRVPLVIDAATFVAASVIALRIGTRRRVTPSPGAPRRGGWSIVRGDSLLRPLVLLFGLVVVLGCAVNVVDVFLVRETLGASTTWYGIVGAVYSAGAVLGAAVSGRLRGVPTMARAFVGHAIALAVGLAAMGLVPSVGLLVPLSVAVGFTNGVLNVTLSALVMGATDPAERGRVGAVLSGTASGTQIIAFAASGALASVLSPREIFVGAGILGALAPLLVGRRLVSAAETRNLSRSSPPAHAAVQASAHTAGEERN